MGTMFMVLTSMFWFPKPVQVSNQVVKFLEMKKRLTGDWTLPKVLIALLIPVLLLLLPLETKYISWNSSNGFIALAKICWSVVSVVNQVRQFLFRQR